MAWGYNIKIGESLKQVREKVMKQFHFFYNTIMNSYSPPYLT